MSIEVHIDWRAETHLVGLLYPAKHGQAISFQYAPEWMAREDAFSIDPTSLPLRAGMHHSPTLLGVIQDCGPDRWGRMLIDRAVRKGVLPRKPYRDIDYVLALDDFSRIGALRFRMGSEEPFLSSGTGVLPPLIQLPALLRAAEAIHGENETAEDLRYLLGVGSPLGGARPKSAVALADGSLAIAKFPKPDDTRDISAGEVLALSLARAAGIRTADHRLVPVGEASVALITRFDRVGVRRIPYISAASLLGTAPGVEGAYTMIADAIRQFGDNVTADLRELWRRMVFSLLASNYDDHLHNHGFLMNDVGRWSLSPAFDLNPVPETNRAQTNLTAISEDQGDPTIAGALDVAARFGLNAVEARTILREVFAAVATWRQTGQHLRIRAGTLQAYESAFENELMREAL